METGNPRTQTVAAPDVEGGKKTSKSKLVVTGIGKRNDAIAAGQRGSFGGSCSNCARPRDTIITVLAGPLNYVA